MPATDHPDADQPSTDPEHVPLLEKRARVPFPLFQICVLCAVRLGEPISQTQISPYVVSLPAGMLRLLALRRHT
jgi:hypothetical protein